jgi:hypothetical protein
VEDAAVLELKYQRIPMITSTSMLHLVWWKGNCFLDILAKRSRLNTSHLEKHSEIHRSITKSYHGNLSEIPSGK